MNLFENNLAVLRRRQPEAASLLEDMKRSREVELRLARTGLPVHRYRGKLLHSEYDPQREAHRCTADVHASHPWVIGFGDAYHLEALLEKGDTEDLVVVEPDGEMLRAVLEDRDLRHVLERASLLVETPPPRVAERIPADRSAWYVHPPVNRLHPRYLEALQALSTYHIHEREPLRILVVGPVDGGSYPIAGYIRSAIEELGHTVSLVDLAAFYPGYKELQAWDTGNGLLVPFEDLLSRLIERRAEVFSPDLIVALAQAPLRGESLKRIRDNGTPVAYWFVEDHRRMPYWQRIAPATDAFFVIQREARDAIQAAGAPFVRYLPLAAQPDIHRPLRLSHEDIERYGSPVSFVGAGYRNRRHLFARLASPAFKVWGNEWDDAPAALEGIIQEGGRRVSTEETVKIFNASLINLNIHSSSCHEAIDPHGDFVNPRTYEIAACGAFQLVDRRAHLREFFTDREIVTIEDLKEAKEKIGYYLEHEEARLEVAKRARGRVLEEHTYALRMKELLGILYGRGLEKRSRDRSIPALEEMAAAIHEKAEITWEDRVLLTLMAFKEEAGCKISSW